MQNTPSQSSETRQAQDQHPEDHVRTGYTVESYDGLDFVVPNALETEPMDLARVLKPDISKALKMPGGVC